MKLIEEIKHQLRKKGYKLTPQRMAILDVITRINEHLTPAAIYERVHEEYPEIGLVTIYRTIWLLNKLELICEVHGGGDSRSYILRRPHGHHHHLVCNECGTVVDFAGCDLGAIEQKLSKETDFEIEDHLLEFSGRCGVCKKTD